MEKLRPHIEAPISARHDGQKPDPPLGFRSQEQQSILKRYSLFGAGSWIRGIRDLGDEILRASFESAGLLTDPVWRGKDVPCGKGETVILIPGLLAGAHTLIPMEIWLRRIGYKPKHFPSTFLSNNRPIKDLAKDLVKTSQKEMGKSGRKVTVVGHSKGGYIEYAALRYYPQECVESVEHMVIMGAPINPPIELNPVIYYPYRLNVMIGKLIWNEADDFKMMREAGDDLTVVVPEGLQLTVIESKRDGIIQGKGNGCFKDGRYDMSHLGMVFNPEAYKVIARCLAGQEIADSKAA